MAKRQSYSQFFLEPIIFPNYYLLHLFFEKCKYKYKPFLSMKMELNINFFFKKKVRSKSVPNTEALSPDKMTKKPTTNLSIEAPN